MEVIPATVPPAGGTSRGNCAYTQVCPKLSVQLPIEPSKGPPFQDSVLHSGNSSSLLAEIVGLNVTVNDCGSGSQTAVEPSVLTLQLASGVCADVTCRTPAQTALGDTQVSAARKIHIQKLRRTLFLVPRGTPSIRSAMRL